jgi:branched-chain amino acid transport system permease protein
MQADKSQQRLKRVLAYGVVALFFLALPAFLSPYGEQVMTRFLIFALFAMSYNIVFGYTGLLSLGHAAFFGTGGYVVGLLKLHYDLDLFWLSAPLGILVATFIAALFGIIALRLSGIYFLLVTLALGQMMFSLAWKVKWLNSPGIQGIVGIPLPNLGIQGFTLNMTGVYYLTLIFLTISGVLLYRLVGSPFGLALVGIREGESRMEALGYNTWLYKYAVFVISAAFAGIAGVLFSYYNSFIDPNHLGLGTSLLPMIMAIMGGLGTFLGPLIGAAAFIFVETYASIVSPLRWPLMLGGLLILTIMFARDGIYVYMLRLLGKVWHGYGSIKS